MTESIRAAEAAMRKALNKLTYHDLGWFGVTEGAVKQALRDAHKAIGEALSLQGGEGEPQSADEGEHAASAAASRHDIRRTHPSMNAHGHRSDEEQGEAIALIRRSEQIVLLVGDNPFQDKPAEVRISKFEAARLCQDTSDAWLVWPDSGNSAPGAARMVRCADRAKQRSD